MAAKHHRQILDSRTLNLEQLERRHLLAAPQLQTVASGFEQLFEFQQDEVQGRIDANFGALGDANQDGIGDIFIAPSCSSRHNSLVLVVSGVDGTILSRLPSSRQFSDCSVAAAGDVSGDGIQDLIVGFTQRESGGGRAIVYSGSDHSTLYEITAPELGESFGESVAGLGDVNQDGVDDFAVSAPQVPTGLRSWGAARVYSGADGTILHEVRGDESQPSYGLVSGVGDTNADGANDFIFKRLVFSGADASLLHRIQVEHRFAGTVDADIRAAGDVNGDGHSDLLYTVDQGDAFRGPVRIHSGADGSILHELGSSRDLLAGFGRSPAALGDVNGDGMDDVSVGAPDENGVGAIEIYSGTDGSLLTKIFGNRPGMWFGANSASADDLLGQQLNGIVVGTFIPSNSMRDVTLINDGNVTVFASVTAPRKYRLSAGDLQRTTGRTITELFPDLSTAGEGQPPTGIAVVDVPASSQWAYSIDDGQTFQAIAQLDSTEALLLGPSDRLRHRSAASLAETETLTIRAWDQTEGARGQFFRINATGGESAFSAGTTAAFVHGDESKRLLVSGLDQQLTYREGTESVAFDDVLIWSANPMAHLTATLSLPSPAVGSLTTESGNGELYDRATGTWTISGSSRQLTEALGSVRFDPSQTFFPTIPIGVTISDTGDPSQTITGEFTLTVEPINDAPRITPTIVTTRLFAAHGRESNEQFGHALSAAGDVNQDGVGDFVVGAPLADAKGRDSGQATILSGRDGQVIRTFHGDGPFDQFGTDVSTAGDVNADGIPDVIIGAELDDFQGYRSGSAYVYSGADGRLLYDKHGGGWQQFGAGIGSAGDLNNDGFDDFIVGAPSLHDDRDHDPVITRVFSGRDGELIHSINGGGGNRGFGRIVGSLGDVTGDGLDDFYIGNANRASQEGVVVYSGQSKRGVYRVATNEDPFPFGSNSFAADVDTGRDVDGDGIRDLVIGAPGQDSVYVFSGVDGLLREKLVGPLNSRFGTSVLIVSDLDGDRFDDIVVGAPGPDDGSAGRVSIYSGRTGVNLISIEGDSAGDQFGASLASAVAEDGRTLLGVAAPFEDKTDLDSGSVLIFELTSIPPTRVLPLLDNSDTLSVSIQDVLEDAIVDADSDAASGIAIQALRGDGQWTYSVDLGTTFLGLDVASVSPSNASLLRDTDRLRYEALPGSTSTAEMVYRAWDQTAGSAGQFVDSTVTGHTSAFSVEMATLRLERATVLQTLMATNLQQSIVFEEDAASVPLDDIMISPNSASAVSARLMVSDPTLGRLTTSVERLDEYDHQTGVWQLTGTATDVNEALANLVFVPSANSTLGGTITVQLAGLDALLEGMIELDVVPVNDRPRVEIGHVATEFFERGTGYYRGAAVAAGGDVNADGFEDFAASTPSPFLGDPGGQIEVRSGLDSSLLYRLASDTRGQFGRFGEWLHFTPDLDGDQIDDLVVGSPRDSGNGRVQVFSGRDGAERLRIDGTVEDKRLGGSVATLDDFSGDGFSDLLVSASGSAKIFASSDGTLIRTHVGETASFGQAVAAIGDLNGDGSLDYAIGEPSRGSLHIYSGDGQPLRRVTPGAFSFGAAVSGLADVSGDGVRDLVVGAPEATNTRGIKSGVAMVISGADASVIRTFEGESSNGARSGAFGATVADAGDLDGDGTTDILIGEPNADNGGPDTGSVYVFSGSDGRLLWQADGEGFEAVFFSGQALGSSIAVGDLNRDGTPDYLAGSPEKGMQSGLFTTYISQASISLPPAELLSEDGVAVSTLLGERVQDVDGDSLGIAAQSFSGNGQWQFALSADQEFEPVAQLTPNEALLLSPDARLRYRRGQQDDRTVVVEFAGWDQTSGQPGATTNTASAAMQSSLSEDTISSQWTFTTTNSPVSTTNLNQTITFEEDAEVVTFDRIVVTDNDPAEEITVTFRLQDFRAGRMNLSEFSGTVAQVNDRMADVRFVPAANYDQNTTITVTISDGGEDGAAPATGLILLEAVPSNDAPTLLREGERAIDTGPINAVGRGRSVWALFPSLVRDVDTASLWGIAVQSIQGAGDWEYSLDGGMTFQKFGSVSSTQSLLLRDTDRVRYLIRRPGVHGPDARFELVGWDRTTGQAGAKVDSSLRGEKTAFSLGSATAVLPVAPADTLNRNLLPGDANQDFGLDQLDIVQALRAGKFETGEEAVWSEGDWNGDGLFGREDLVELLASGRYLDGVYFQAMSVSADSFNLVEDATEVVLDVLANDRPSENGLLEILSVTRPSRGGIVSIADGTTLVYSPPPGFNGEESFEYTVGDGSVLSQVVRVTVAIAPANDAPRVRPVDDPFHQARLRAEHIPLFGNAISGAGDVNADGFDDVLVGGVGSAQVFSGFDLSVLMEITGPAQTDDSLVSVSNLGDVNRDGHSDFVVSWNTNILHANSETIVRAYSGSDGTILYQLQGAEQDWLGASLASISDLNGDGAVDLLVGAPREWNASMPGKIVVVSGKDGSRIAEIAGSVAGDNFGHAVSRIADINGDGLDEILVGAENLNQGRGPTGGAFVYSGADGSVLHSLVGAVGDQFGHAVAGLDDVNDDGIPDFAVTAPADDHGGINTGSVYVYSGQDGSVIHRIDGLGINRQSFGLSVSGVDDFDADGVSDLIAGGFDGIPHQGRDSGILRLFSGRTGELLHEIFGPRTSRRFSGSVTAAGDLNGDGIREFIVGANGDENRGAAFAYSTGNRVELRRSIYTAATVGRLFGDVLFDVDAENEPGIAIYSTKGSSNWQYSLDRGQTFIDVGDVSTSAALLLRRQDILRYMGDAADAGGIAFRAWDQSMGEVGAKFDTDTNGGATPFSASGVVATLPVEDRTK